MKAYKTRMNHWGCIEWIESFEFENLPVEYRRTMKNDEERWRTTKNFYEITYENVSKALRKHLNLDFLHKNNFFHPKKLKCIAKGIRDIWNNLPLPIYRKRGEEVVAQLSQASWVASSFSNTASKMLQKGLDLKIWKFLLAPPSW